jgi:hypothetical protein
MPYMVVTVCPLTTALELLEQGRAYFSLISAYEEAVRTARMCGLAAVQSLDTVTTTLDRQVYSSVAGVMGPNTPENQWHGVVIWKIDLV